MTKKKEPAHALLSASRGRWLSCTPSAVLESKQPDDSNPSSEEGTLAHNLGEIKVQLEFKQITKAMYNKKETELRKNEYFSDEMIEICDAYTRYVRETFDAMEKEYGSAYIQTETRLDYSHIAKDGFGTGDVIICSPGAIHVIDLKYGIRIYVSPVDNTQLKLYGIGALKAFDIIYEPDIVTMTVYQPRMNNIGAYYVTSGSLRAWGDSIKARADLAYEGKGEFAPNMDNCRFCKVNGKCRALKEHNKKMLDYLDLPFMSDTETKELLDNRELINKQISELEKEVFNRIYNNCEKFDGYKVVQSAGRRYYKDTEKIKEALINAGYEEAIIMKAPDLVNLTEMGKLLNKKEFDELIGEFIKKKEGNPSLVKAAAKGDPITVLGDFKDV